MIEFPLIVCREYHTPNGYMVHLRDDDIHYVFLNDGLYFRLIALKSDWDSSDDAILDLFTREKVVFDEDY